MTFDLISEFTLFNLVVRLSKVKQLAFFQVLTQSMSLVEQLLAVPGIRLFSDFHPVDVVG